MVHLLWVLDSLVGPEVPEKQTDSTWYNDFEFI